MTPEDFNLRIAERNFAIEGGMLLVAGVPVRDLASLYGTPLYVYTEDVLERNLSRLRGALPDGFEVYYSIKANPNHGIVRFFVQQGCGLEIASAGEFYRALKAGCAPERTLFAGPGKTQEELEYAVGHGIGEIHVESFTEIEALSSIARALGRTARLALRVNPSEDAQGGAMRMGGKPSPFGIPEEDLAEAVAAVQKKENLELCGLHLFTGTQILDHEVLLRQYRKAFELARTVAVTAGKPLATVDLGGGLGIPYFPGDEELDICALGEGLGDIVAEARAAPGLAAARCILEPGRHLVGEAGVYLARVTTVKRCRGKTFVVVDGGLHHHLAASGNFGQVIKRNFPVCVANKLGADAVEAADIVGPLCTPLDVLARGVSLPEVEAGDLVGVLQSGAYAVTASPIGFLSHRAPAEVLVSGGTPRVVRRRGRTEDLLSGQLDLAPEGQM